MIKFTNTNDEYMSEAPGFIDDILHHAGIDQEQIKNDWQDEDNKGPIKKGGVINDDVLDPLANTTEEMGKKINSARISAPSIAARAKKATLQFPIYASQSLRVNEATIISQLFERVYASMVQTVLAMNPIIDSKEVNNLKFLDRFHSNLKESADRTFNEFYEPIDDWDQMIQDSIYCSREVAPGVTLECAMVPLTDADLYEEHLRLINPPLTGLRYLQEKKVGEKKKETTVSSGDSPAVQSTISFQLNKMSEEDWKEVGYNEVEDRLTEEQKKWHGASNKTIQDELGTTHPDEVRRAKLARDEADRIIDDKIKEIKDIVKDNNPKKWQIEDGDSADIKREKKHKLELHNRYSYSGGVWYRNDKKTQQTSSSGSASASIRALQVPRMLKDTEVRKVNSLLPYTMEAHFRVRSEDGRIETEVAFLINVKTILHPIRIEDLGEDLEDLISSRSKALRKVKYTSGEISFLDYVFNIKQIKASAAKELNYNKRWLGTLKRLGEYRKLNGTPIKVRSSDLSSGAAPFPNATLVLTQNDVEALKDSTGIDLESVSNCTALIKSIFLLGVVIIDSSAGSMKILIPDQSKSWEIQSLSSIEESLAKEDNSKLMKELQKAVVR